MTKKLRSGKSKKKNTLPSVLLIEANAQESGLYGELIQEAIQCDLDVMNRVSENIDWLARSRYHLIIVDLAFFRNNNQIPDGISVLEKIKTASPGTSVILISEYATIEQA